MVERVTINEPTQQEIEPEEVEEEVQEEVVEEEVVEASEEVTEESEDSTERPEWLPEKFESAEDLAKAYSELESKLGKGEDSEESPETPKEALNVEKYADEYADKGELSEDAFKALEEYGIPKDLVEKFIEGQSALQQNQISQIYNSVGGEEKFEQIKSTRIPRLNKSWKCTRLCHQGKTTFEGTHIKPQLNRYGEVMTKCQQVHQAIEVHGIDAVSQKYKQIGHEVTKYKAPGSTE